MSEIVWANRPSHDRLHDLTRRMRWFAGETLSGFCKLWDERKPRKAGAPYDFQIFTEETREKTERELLGRLKTLYEEGRKKDPEVFKDDIRLSASKARTVVSYLESINLSDTDLDSKGRAFETFMGSFFRGDFGQYFTPRVIVKFMVDVLPITHESLVLDTACGSGGFLLHALDKVRQQAGEFYKPGTDKYHRHWHDFAEPAHRYGFARFLPEPDKLCVYSLQADYHPRPRAGVSFTTLQGEQY